jgi:hypothetical protein
MIDTSGILFYEIENILELAFKQILVKEGPEIPAVIFINLFQALPGLIIRLPGTEKDEGPDQMVPGSIRSYVGCPVILFQGFLVSLNIIISIAQIGDTGEIQRTDFNPLLIGTDIPVPRSHRFIDGSFGFEHLHTVIQF